jgi:hypothetical protein
MIMEMAEEYGLNHKGENNDEEDEMMTMMGMLLHPPHLRLLPCLRRSLKKKPPWRMVHRSRMIWMTWMIWMMIQMRASLTWMSGFPMMGVMIEVESSSLSL